MRTEAEIIERKEQLSQELEGMIINYDLEVGSTLLISDVANQLRLIKWVLGEEEAT